MPTLTTHDGLRLLVGIIAFPIITAAVFVMIHHGWGMTRELIASGTILLVYQIAAVPALVGAILNVWMVRVTDNRIFRTLAGSAIGMVVLLLAIAFLALMVGGVGGWEAKGLAQLVLIAGVVGLLATGIVEWLGGHRSRP